MTGAGQAAGRGSERARNRNELWARTLLDEMARSGVRQVIVAPGSRSAPLVLAAAGDGRFRVVVQVDERSAGFLALGVGKGTGTPAVVVTTSGTAVANLLPAVVEASRSETPLLVVTADRPPRLRGADANQVVDQVGIFGDHPRLSIDLPPADVTEPALRHLRSVCCRAVAAAVGDPAGPVHLNVGFDLPLEPVPVAGDLPEATAAGRTPGSGGRPDGAPWTRIAPFRPTTDERTVEAVAGALRGARRPLLVGGVVPRPWETGPALRRVASALGIPLVADALSGARFPAPREDGRGAPAEADGPTIAVGYDLFLRDPEVARELRPDLILRIGAAATSAVLLDWMAKSEGVRHIVVDGGAVWKDHQAVATEMVRADPARFLTALAARAGGAVGESGWRDRWSRVARGASSALGALGRGELFEGLVAAEIGRLAAADEALFVSSSLPVRDVDAFLGSREGPLLVLANRGASGIDGVVSTAAGVSLGTGRRVIVLVGDLAFLHDANGLAALRDAGVRVLVVVVNNDGGGIFHLLPIREHEPAFTPYFVTPQGRDLSHLAALHGIPYDRVEGNGGVEALQGAIRSAFDRVRGSAGSAILEVRTDREENRRRRDEAAKAVASAASAAVAAGG